MPKYALVGNELVVTGDGEVSSSWKQNYLSSKVQIATLNEGITRILQNSFSYCESLRKINLPDSLSEIQKSTFSFSGIQEIHIPKNVKIIDTEYFVYSANQLLKFTVDSENDYFSSDQGLLYSKNGDKLISAPSGLSSYVIREGVLTFGRWAIAKSLVENVLVPDSVVSIESMSFVDNKNIQWINFTAKSCLTSIGYDAFYVSSIKGFTCPPNVTVISEMSFYSNSIRYFDFFKGLRITEIQDSTFLNCISLVKVDLPNTVTKISPKAFVGCTLLKSVNIIGESKSFISINGSLYNAEKTQLIFVPPIVESLEIPAETKTISQSLLQSIRSLKSIVIHPDNENLYYYNGTIYNFNKSTTLYSIGGLEHAVIKAETTDIGESTYSGNTILKSVTFENNSLLKNIWNSAFQGCFGLQSVILPQGLQTIYPMAFRGAGPPSLDVPDSVVSFHYYSFGESLTQTMTFLPSSRLTTLAIRAFGASSIRHINLPSSLETISDNAFADSQVKSIKFEGNLKQIDSKAFKKCEFLTRVEFNSILSRIPDNCFEGCIRLKTLIINGNIQRIDSNAFRGCSNLSDITFNGTPGLRTIGDSAFSESNISSFPIFSSLESIAPAAFYCCFRLTRFTAQYEVPTVYDVREGALFRHANSSLCIFPPGLTGGSVPPGTNALEERAFYGCQILENLEFGSGSNIGAIGRATFFECMRLNSLQLPASIASIEVGAFEGCSSLVSILVVGNSRLSKIGDSVFAGCGNLETFRFLGTSVLSEIGFEAFSGTKLLSFAFSSLIRTIGDSAFSNCQKLSEITFVKGTQNLESIPSNCFKNAALASVVLPSSVRAIKDGAFAGCARLQSVDIPMTAASIGSSAFAGCSISTLVLPTDLVSLGASAFSGNQNLRNVIYCGKAVLKDETVFIGSAPNIVTLIEYQETMFCGRECMRVMERCMVFPSNLFTPFAMDEDPARIALTVAVLVADGE